VQSNHQAKAGVNVNYYTPKEISRTALNTTIRKAQMPIKEMLILGILAGAYIGFAAEGSTMAIHDVSAVGVGRFLAGVIFATGLMLVVIGGGELFTGNVLLWVGFLQKEISVSSLLRNWFWVYTGNLVGAVILAWMMQVSGLWSYNNFLHGAYALKLALGKVHLTFGEAFVRGILCNWLVCLAVWLAYAAKDAGGKIWGIFFPIMLFITSAFEHSIANMYYLTAGLLLKASPAVVAASSYGSAIQDLTVYSVIWNNIIPVTLGNIVGGAFFVGSLYWFCYLRTEKLSQRSISKCSSQI
jgi:formate/nitrite transporter